MTHFDIGTFTDHLRGDDPPELHARIAAHLTKGCAECARTRDAARAMLAFAERHQRATPPDEVVQRALGIFARRSPTPGIVDVLATLAHDSMGAPVAAGLRATTQDTRHLRYVVEGHGTVDLHMTYDRRRDVVTLTGQVDTDGPPTGAPAVISLMDGPSVVGQADCSEFGEFVVEGPARRRYALQILLAHLRITVPLEALPTQQR